MEYDYDGASGVCLSPGYYAERGRSKAESLEPDELREDGIIDRVVEELEEWVEHDLNFTNAGPQLTKKCMDSAVNAFRSVVKASAASQLAS